MAAHNVYISPAHSNSAHDSYIERGREAGYQRENEGSERSSPRSGVLRSPSDLRQKNLQNTSYKQTSVSWSSIDDKIEFTDTESYVSEGIYSVLPAAANRSKSASNLSHTNHNHSTVPYFPPNHSTFSLPRTSSNDGCPIAPPRSSTLPKAFQTSLSDPSLPPPPPPTNHPYYKTHYKPIVNPYDRATSLSSSIHEELELNMSTFDSDKYKSSLFPLPDRTPLHSMSSGSKGKVKLVRTSDTDSVPVKVYLFLSQT